MIDPPDLLERYREGDAGELPESGSGPNGQPPDNDYQPLPGHGSKMWAPYEYTLTAGGPGERVMADMTPDYWLVYGTLALGTANVETAIYNAEAVGGNRAKIGPKGKAVIPGISPYLWVVPLGSSDSRVGVIAVKGHDFADIEW